MLLAAVIRPPRSHAGASRGCVAKGGGSDGNETVGADKNADGREEQCGKGSRADHWVTSWFEIFHHQQRHQRWSVPGTRRCFMPAAPRQADMRERGSHSICQVWDALDTTSCCGCVLRRKREHQVGRVQQKRFGRRRCASSHQSEWDLSGASRHNGSVGGTSESWLNGML